MGKKEIEKAIDDLQNGDNVAFINAMKDEMDDVLANDDTFKELGAEIQKYSSIEDDEE